MKVPQALRDGTATAAQRGYVPFRACGREFQDKAGRISLPFWVREPDSMSEHRAQFYEPSGCNPDLYDNKKQRLVSAAS